MIIESVFNPSFHCLFLWRSECKMSTYAIGDIQGCYHELIELLSIIQFNPDHDTLWLAGDLVNRGPHSLDVLRLIKSFGDRQVTVLGNHDLHFLAVAMKCQNLRLLDTFQDALAAPDLPELVSWLRSRPLFHYDPRLQAVLVHAGIYPGWNLDDVKCYANEVENILRGDDFPALLSAMYGNRPDSWSETLTGWDRYRFIINTLARMRYCTKDGRLNMKEKCAVGSQPANLYPWFGIPNPKIQNVDIIFGHWASLNGVTETPHVFAIDTGCSWGHRLTSLRLEDKRLFSTGDED